MFSDCTSEESDSSGSSFLIWGVSSTVEQLAVNQEAEGSNPSRPAILMRYI